MKTMLRVALLMLGGMLMAPAAHATGNFVCTVEDESLKFSAESTFSHGLGEQFMGFGATGTVLLADAPKDFVDLKFAEDNLVHHWFAGSDLRLHLYRERSGPHGYVELILETTQSGDDETVFEGTYKLILYDMTDARDGEGKRLEAEGKASCSVG